MLLVIEMLKLLKSFIEKRKLLFTKKKVQNFFKVLKKLQSYPRLA